MLEQLPAMAIDPTLIAAGVNVAGNLLGGLFGGKSAKKQAAADWERQLHMAQNAIQYRVVDAQKAGISPLAAMGISMPGTVSRVGQSSMGSAVADAAAAAAAGIEGYSAKKMAKRQADIAEAQARANIELTRAQTAEVRSRAYDRAIASWFKNPVTEANIASQAARAAQSATPGRQAERISEYQFTGNPAPMKPGHLDPPRYYGDEIIPEIAGLSNAATDGLDWLADRLLGGPRRPLSKLQKRIRKRARQRIEERKNQ